MEHCLENHKQKDLDRLMIYKKYKGKIQCGFPNHIWPHGEAQVREFFLLEKRRLDKVFYFYMNDPKDPLVVNEVKFRKGNGFGIHPGLNRYIGVSLRRSNTWIDAFINLQGEKIKYPGIVYDKFIEQKEIDDKIDDNEWAKENAEMPRKQELEFFDSCTQYVNDMIPDYKAYIKLESDVLYLKETGTKEIVVDINDCDSLIDAIQRLFEKVKNV